MKKLSFKDRSALTPNPAAKKLFHIMEEKKSNLSLAADCTTCAELLFFAEALGSHICLLKTHIDILEDFTPSVLASLQQIAKRHHFLLFEDRKFADIGNTVTQQYGAGLYKIAQWADITNAHILPGPGIIAGLQEIGLPLRRGLLLLAEMSSEGALTDASYAQHAMRMAEHFPDFVIGFIAQRRLCEDQRFLFLTPGIHLRTSQDALGQQWRSPESAIASGTDIIIVGRAIYAAQDPKQEAILYRTAAWNAYVASLNT